MKIWIKYFIGIALGVLLGMYLPAARESVYGMLSFLTEIIILIGRYTLFPLIFFSLAYGTYKLKQENRFLKFYGKSILYVAVTGIVLSAFGVLSVLLFAPDRIPIIIEQQNAYGFPGYREIFFDLFPANVFLIFNNNGDYLLPIAFFAVFLGLNSTFDKVMTRSAVQLFDSLSRIFYHMSIFVIELMGFGMIVLSAFLTVTLRTTVEIEFFSQLFLLLGLNTAIIMLGIYPLMLYFLGGKQNPYKWVYAVLAPAAAGFMSGNSYFALIPLIRHGKKSLGIPRRVGSTTYPVFGLFAKAGTAMVTSVTFIVIFNSYSSLGITISGIIWVMAFSFLASLLTGSVPGMGVIVSLSFLCGLYGRGLEEGFLIITPAAPILLGFSAAIDTVTNAFGSWLVSRGEKGHKETAARDFI